MKFIVKSYQAVIIDIVQLECFTKGHIDRDEYILRKIFDPLADMSIIGFSLIIEADKNVLWLYPAHDTFEQAGLSATITAEHPCDSAGLGSDESTLKNLQLIKFQVNTIYKESVN